MKKANSDMHTRRRGLSEKGSRRGHKKEYSEKSLLELLSEDGELPQAYAETRIVMIPVDPYLVHVYWEINHEEIAEALRRFNGDAGKYKPVLRFYRLNAEYVGNCFFDVDIHLGANNWYVHLQHPDMLCCVKLGFRYDCGWFFVLISSLAARHLSGHIRRNEAALNIKKGVAGVAFKPFTDEAFIHEKQISLREECEFFSAGCTCHCEEAQALTQRDIFSGGACAISLDGEMLSGLTDLCEYSFASGISSR